MKKLSIIALAVLVVSSCGKRVSESAKVSTGLDSFSYVQGVMFCTFLKCQGITDVNYSAIYRGLQEGLKKDSGFLVDQAAMNTVAQAYVQGEQQRKIAPLRKATTEFLGSLESKGYKKLPSGAYYKLIKTGAGLNARPQDTLDMVFTINNQDGKKMISSQEMGQGPSIKVPLSLFQLQPLNEALEIIPAGSTFELAMATDLYPVLSRFVKQFDDGYKASIATFEILNVIPGPAPKAQPSMPPAN